MHIFKSIEDPELAALIKTGAVGVLPTDTVYGLVCSAANKDSVERLYSLKSRQAKPGTLIAESIEQIESLGIPRRYLTAVDKYWPNPISIIIPTTPELSYLDQGKMSLAMRVVNHAGLAKLLSFAGPLLTTSANEPGKPEATNMEAAKQYFADQVDFYVDGGDLSGQKASTVIRVIDDAVEVVRQGAVEVNEKGEIV